MIGCWGDKKVTKSLPYTLVLTSDKKFRWLSSLSSSPELLPSYSLHNWAPWPLLESVLSLNHSVSSLLTGTFDALYSKSSSELIFESLNLLHNDAVPIGFHGFDAELSTQVTYMFVHNLDRLQCSYGQVFRWRLRSCLKYRLNEPHQNSSSGLEAMILVWKESLCCKANRALNNIHEFVTHFNVYWGVWRPERCCATTESRKRIRNEKTCFPSFYFTIRWPLYGCFANREEQFPSFTCHALFDSEA